jgi:hypothetical protein
MRAQHKELAAGGWYTYSLVQQLANVGSEVIRTINWKNKGNSEYSRLAFERALELFDLTIIDPKNRKRLKEIARAREVFVGYFIGEDPYHTTDESLKDYFLSFNYAARTQY